METDRRQHWGLLAQRAIASIFDDLKVDCHEQDTNAPFDLLLSGRIRVEVKAARWTSHVHGLGRYQFNIRSSADWYILCCCNGLTYHFIVPASAIAERHNVTIYCKDATKYRGIWREYLENWGPLLKECMQ